MSKILKKYLPNDYHDTIIDGEDIAIIDDDQFRCIILIDEFKFIVLQIDLKPIPLHYFVHFVERALEWNARALPPIGTIAFKINDDKLVINHAFHIKDMEFNLFSKVYTHCIDLANIWNDALALEFPPLLPENTIQTIDPKKDQPFFGLY